MKKKIQNTKKKEKEVNFLILKIEKKIKKKKSFSIFSQPLLNGSIEVHLTPTQKRTKTIYMRQ